MAKSPFKVVGRKSIYKGRIIELIREILEIDGKRWVRETVLHPGAVVIVPVLPDGRVVLIRQYRRAIGRFILEIPAGTRDKKESPSACAHRELTEETGWKAKRMTKLAQFYSAPGFTSELMILYLATKLEPGDARPEPDEWVKPVVVPMAEALRRVLSGKIVDAKTIIGLLLADAHLHGAARKRRLPASPKSAKIGPLQFASTSSFHGGRSSAG